MRAVRTLRSVVLQADAPSRDETLVARARKHHARGESRKALTALREACLRDERAAWLWTLYAARLAEAGQKDDAGRAIRHALWLRRSAGDSGRARSTEALFDRLGLPRAA